MTGSYDPDKYPHQTGWRAYQEYLRRNGRPPRRFRLKRGHWLSAGLLVFVLVGLAKVFLGGGDEKASLQAADVSPAKPVMSAPRESGLIEKADVHVLLGKTRFINLETQPPVVTFDGRPFRVDTSLDLGLQQYLLKKMDRVNSRYIGIVAMQPDTGRLLAMAGFNKIDPDQDPCMVADYPAASLFKIVTAAAAVEKKGYTAGSRLKFNGYKHTLYKRQLTDRTNRYTNAISFRDSFAQSVNPVFGKIGALYLDRQDLVDYGNAFAFNREVTFELPWSNSRLTVKDDPYRRAEIASGFNRLTTMSPLHGAVIVSAVVNGGRPVEPSLVERIVDDNGNTVYRTEPRFLPAAISPQTAGVLDQLMTTTIKSGTAKKVFRGYRRNKVLSRLKLGGKTGSIYNRKHDARFDWFVGYATEKKGDEQMVVSVMVAHEEYIGIRAGQYARMAIERHFKDYFTKKDQAGKDSSG
jgi:peptidoglycan glycosyltransferase